MPDEFRAELRRIVCAADRLEIVELDDPASHGWLRRSEFDRDGLHAWETVDGNIVGLLRCRPTTKARSERSGPDRQG